MLSCISIINDLTGKKKNAGKELNWNEDQAEKLIEIKKVEIVSSNIMYKWTRWSAYMTTKCK